MRATTGVAVTTTGGSASARAGGLDATATDADASVATAPNAAIDTINPPQSNLHTFPLF